MKIEVARKHMVDSQVRPNDVTDLNLQMALETLPREEFVPSASKAMAYAEMDIDLFDGRYLLQARDFAKLIHAASITEGDLVLDLGCGFGYSSAVLSKMAGMVMAVEESEETVKAAEENLNALSIDNAVVVQGALKDGLADQGPYDAIVIAAGGVEELPTNLVEQLKDGGRLVCIMMEDGLGHACVVTRSGENFGQISVFEATPNGVVAGFEAPKQFSF